MRLFALALPVLLLLDAAQAKGAFVVYQTSFVASGNDHSPGGTIPLFDPSAFGGGKLLAVDIEYKVSAAGGPLYLTNQEDQLLPVFVYLLSGSYLGTYGLSGGGDVILFQGAAPVAPVDDVLGPLMTLQYHLNTQYKGAYSAASTASFVGKGDYQFVNSNEFMIDTIVAPGSVGANISPDWSASIEMTVIYTYSTPAPAGVVLLASGAPFLVLLSRRRKARYLTTS